MMYLQPYVFRFVNFSPIDSYLYYKPKTVKIQPMLAGQEQGAPVTYQFQYPNVTEVRGGGVTLEACGVDRYNITVCFVDPDGGNLCMNSSINIVPVGQVFLPPTLVAVEASPPGATFKLLPPSGIEMKATSARRFSTRGGFYDL